MSARRAVLTMNPGDRAWIAFGLAGGVYELVALRRGWPLLSEAVDGYRRSHPVLTELTIVYLSGHLRRRWPERYDPLTRLGTWGALHIASRALPNRNMPTTKDRDGNQSG